MFDQLRTNTKRQKAPSGVDPVAEACRVLLAAAGESSWPRHREGQLTLLRRARARTHPDLGIGREEWDKVDAAAKFLRLHTR